MPITFPQTNNGGFGTAGSSLAVSFASGIAAGSVIVAAGSCQGLPAGITLADGHGDPVTFGIPLTVDGTIGSLYFLPAFLTPTTAAQTITATYTGGANPGFGDMFIGKVAGLLSPVFDKAIQAASNTVAVDSGSTGSLSASAEAAVGYAFSSGILN